MRAFTCASRPRSAASASLAAPTRVRPYTPGVNTEHDNLVPRVVALETNVAQIMASVGRIEAKVTARDRPNYGLFVSFGSFGVGLITVLWGVAIRPIQGQVDGNSAAIDRNVAAIARLTDQSTRLMGLLEEAESQVGHVADVVNLETQTNERLLAIVADKAGVVLPQRDYWPLGNLLRRRMTQE